MDRPATLPAPPSAAAGTPALQADEPETDLFPAETRIVEIPAVGTSTVESSAVEAADETSAEEVPAGLTRAAESEEAQGGGHIGFELPRIGALLMHAAPRFIEGCVAPVAVFYAALVLLGLNGALVAAVAWVYGGIVYRYVRGHPVSGLLLLAAIGVTVRASLSAATGSAVVYFLQPTLGTLCVSMAFLASVPLGKPLAMKLAKDMAPIPDAFYKNDRVHRFFLRISLLWSAVLLANVGVSLWMLFSQSISMYLWIRTGIVAALGVLGIAVSVWGFKRVLRHVNRESGTDAAAV